MLFSLFPGSGSVERFVTSVYHVTTANIKFDVDKRLGNMAD